MLRIFLNKLLIHVNTHHTFNVAHVGQNQMKMVYFIFKTNYTLLEHNYFT